MKTANDIELVSLTRTIHKEAAMLDRLAADRRSDALLTALAKIEDAARKAGWRVLDLQK